MARTRVRPEAWQGQRAWRKSYADGGHRRRIAALRWVARRLGADALLAPLPLTAERACRTEQAMINRLSALGVRVPPLLQVGERELLLGDLGPTLAVVLRAERGTAARRDLVALGLRAIGEVHSRGAYLSQAFARNLTMLDGEIGFIDLEEDPATTMSLAAAQARDLLFYAHSTARFLSGRPGAHAGLLRGHLQGLPAQVRAEFERTARALRWQVPVARLPGGRAREVADSLESLALAAR